MKYIKCSGGTEGRWAPASCRREYLSWLLGECYVVLGAMKRVKVRDKVMIEITIFHGNIYVP